MLDIRPIIYYNITLYMNRFFKFGAILLFALFYGLFIDISIVYASNDTCKILSILSSGDCIELLNSTQSEVTDLNTRLDSKVSDKPIEVVKFDIAEQKSVEVLAGSISEFNEVKDWLSKAQEFFSDVYSSALNLVNRGLSFFSNKFSGINTKAEYYYLKFKDLYSPKTFNQYSDINNIKNSDFRRDKKIEYINKTKKVVIKDGDKKWSEEEVDWIEEVINVMPQNFLETKDLTNPILLRDKKNIENKAVCAHNEDKSIITVFDTSKNCISADLMSSRKLISEFNKLSFKHTLTHELSHYFDNKNNIYLMSKFYDYSWIKGKVKSKNSDITFESLGKDQPIYILKDNPEGFPSTYAGELYYNIGEIVLETPYGKPGEDFSECIAYYQYHPIQLQNVSIKKYNFIKSFIFKGKEFHENNK